MEAKDTVISACRLCSSADNQAEISFKAGMEQGEDLILKNNNMADILHQARQEGIKEVAEWLKTRIEPSKSWDEPDYCDISLDDLQAKLKEWGLIIR